jgi:hypothetical protein
MEKSFIFFIAVFMGLLFIFTSEPGQQRVYIKGPVNEKAVFYARAWR